MCQGRASLAPYPARLQLCHCLCHLERGPGPGAACCFGCTQGAPPLCERTCPRGIRRSSDPTTEIFPRGEAESGTTSPVSTLAFGYDLQHATNHLLYTERGVDTIAAH